MVTWNGGKVGRAAATLSWVSVLMSAATPWECATDPVYPMPATGATTAKMDPPIPTP